MHSIMATVAELTDVELHALAASASEAPQITPGPMAWLEHVADCELRRRAGADYRLQAPEAAIPPEEDAASLAAAMMLQSRFAPDAPAVAALFAAIVGALTGSTLRH